MDRFHTSDGRLIYRALAECAERIAKSRNDRARKLCFASGLDGNLLGIHPHNAMIDYRAGRPWHGVNYSLVRQCIRVCDSQWDAKHIVDRIYKTRSMTAFAFNV